MSGSSSPLSGFDPSEMQVTNPHASRNPVIRGIKGFVYNLSYKVKNLKILNVLVIVFLVGSLGVGVMAVQRTQDIREQASVLSADLELPSQISMSVDEEISIPIMLLSDSVSIKEISVALRFNPKHLNLISIITYPDENILDRYTPVVNGQFDEFGVITTANNGGVARFRILSSHQTPFRGIRGVDEPLASLVFKAVDSTSEPTKIEYVTQSGATMILSSDTGENVLGRTGETIVTIN